MRHFSHRNRPFHMSPLALEAVGRAVVWWQRIPTQFFPQPFRGFGQTDQRLWWTLRPNLNTVAQGVRLRTNRLGFRDDRAELLQAGLAGGLHRHGALEIREAEAAAGPGPAVGRQDMVGAAGVVAERLGRPVAEEDGTGSGDVREQGAWVGHR